MFSISLYSITDFLKPRNIIMEYVLIVIDFLIIAVNKKKTEKNRKTIDSDLFNNKKNIMRQSEKEINGLIFTDSL